MGIDRRQKEEYFTGLEECFSGPENRSGFPGCFILVHNFFHTF
jgi:hypothetical protein